jgi:simple sugar transport system permease protein
MKGSEALGARDAARGSAVRRLVKLVLSRPEVTGLLMLIVVVIGFQLYAPQFLSERNIQNIVGIIPELGLVAVGVTILMISGEFDLSVGSVFAITPMSAVIMTMAGLDPWLAMLIALAVALSIGFVNGWITLTFNIPSFVTTLGMLFVVRSLTVVVSGGFPPPLPSEMPTEIFADRLGAIRYSVFWFAGIAVMLAGFLHYSNFGNWIYATGGAPQAAQDMGIDTRRVKMTCFMLCSFLAGFAGLIQVFRMRSPLPSLGEGMELQAIAASVIGGAALSGGVGSVLGAIIGTSIIRVIENGLVMARVDANWFRLAVGALTILAVILNIYIRRRATSMRT